jgi:hypothetical protein
MGSARFRNETRPTVLAYKRAVHLRTEDEMEASDQASSKGASRPPRWVVVAVYADDEAFEAAIERHPYANHLREALDYVKNAEEGPATQTVSDSSMSTGSEGADVS